MSLLQRLIKRLDLQQLETDVYVGGSGEGGCDGKLSFVRRHGSCSGDDGSATQCG